MSGFEDLDEAEIEDLRAIHRTHDRILELQKAGLTIEEIARTVGWDETTVRVFLTGRS